MLDTLEAEAVVDEWRDASGMAHVTHTSQARPIRRTRKPTPLPVPYPTIILFGCGPLVPTPEGEDCPTCGWVERDADGLVVAHHPGIAPGDDSTICGRCSSMSPTNEGRITNADRRRRRRIEWVQEQRGRNAEARARRRAADDVVKRDIVLSESHRRRIWNGYQGGTGSPIPTTHVNNAAATGRAWLKAIGQEPDWSIDLTA